MLSKNNRRLLRQKGRNSKQRFAIKKLTVGVASVLIGLSFMGLSAKADQVSPQTQTLNVSQIQPQSAQNLTQSAVQDTNTTTAKVPSDYASAMQGFRPDTGNTQATVNAASEGIQENGGSQTEGFNTASYSNGVITMPGNYQHNAADEAQSVDLNNVSSDQSYEMAQFAGSLVNQIRTQVQAQPNGTKVSAGLVKVSPYASQFGQNMVNSAYAYWPAMSHNLDGLKNYANGQGLNTNYIGENLSSGIMAEQLKGSSTVSMDDVKQAIYTSLMSMMYFDNNSYGVGAGGHTTAILNDPEYNSNSLQGGNAIGLDSNGNLLSGNQYLTVSIDGMHQIHYNFISDANASDSLKNELAANSYTPNSSGVVNPDNPSRPVVDNKDYGNLDGYTVTDAGNGNVNISVNGWQATNASEQEGSRFLILYDRTKNHEIARISAQTVARPDVQKAYSNIYNSANAGFKGTFTVNGAALSDQLCVVSRYSDDAVHGEGQHTDYWSGNLNINNGNFANLDDMSIQNNKLVVSGWHATNQAVGKANHYIIVLDAANGHELARTKVSGQRADVANVYPTVANAGESGFSASFALRPEFANDNIQIVSRWTSSNDGNSDYVDYWFAPKRLLSDTGNYGNLDGVSIKDGKLNVTGWHASNEALGKNYHYIILWDQNLGHEVARQLVTNGTDRADVERAYSDVLNSGNSGFNTSFALNSNMVNDNLQVISRWTDDPVGNGNAVDYWFNAFKLDQGNYGNLDSFVIDNGTVTTSGWHATNQAYGKDYHFLILFDKTKNQEVSRQIVAGSRDDVAKAYPQIVNAAQSGFNATFTYGQLERVGDQLQIVSRWTSDPLGNSNYVDYWFAPQVVPYSLTPSNPGTNTNPSTPTDTRTDAEKYAGQVHVQDIHVTYGETTPTLPEVTFDNDAAKNAFDYIDIQGSNIQHDANAMGPNGGTGMMGSTIHFKDGSSYMDNWGLYVAPAATQPSQSSQSSSQINKAYEITRLEYDPSERAYVVEGRMASDAHKNYKYAFVITLDNGKEVDREFMNNGGMGHYDLQTGTDDPWTDPWVSSHNNIYDVENSWFGVYLPSSCKKGDKVQFVLRFSNQTDGEGNYDDMTTPVYTLD